MEDIIRYCIIPYFDNYDDLSNIANCLNSKTNITISLKNCIPLFPSKFYIKEFTLNNELGYLITDDILANLKDIKTLDLWHNKNITDKGLVHLKGIHTLILTHNNNNITDKGLVHLKGIHTLDLWQNTRITDNGLVHLKGIHTLILPFNENITDNGLVHLQGIHTLNLKYNENITKKAFTILKECKIINKYIFAIPGSQIEHLVRLHLNKAIKKITKNMHIYHFKE